MHELGNFSNAFRKPALAAGCRTVVHNERDAVIEITVVTHKIRMKYVSVEVEFIRGKEYLIAVGLGKRRPYPASKHEIVEDIDDAVMPRKLRIRCDLLLADDSASVYELNDRRACVEIKNDLLLIGGASLWQHPYFRRTTTRWTAHRICRFVRRRR